ncbi:phasin family protein [Virgibacillus chiguensis]|uniref:Polyhydroxyalkanoate synthesis regulator phasin n=1 Tax=Virgibacillus chiguensis TaxID=411959 RepID=A0A1M5U4D3_9BACI|nr:hypothetical protein [Virgibacillus chiguensis]SHH57955.1 Polyhydroxyalkanoate synthesis regulator phasin [Virgibacillus chiguensis]
MNDLLKKGFLLGLGAAVTSKEKFESRMKQLVEKNELTQEQAKTLLKQFVDKGEAKKGEWQARQNEQTQKLANDIGIATKEEVEELRNRVAVLENKIENH